MQGSRFSRAISCARRCFFTVIGIVGAALDGGVVAHDHAFAPLDAADAGDDAGAVDRVLVHAVGGERRELEKRRAGVDQAQHAFSRKKLSARRMPVARTLPARRARLARGAPPVVERARASRAALARNSVACVSIAEASFIALPALLPIRWPHDGAAYRCRECAFMEHHILARSERRAEHRPRAALGHRGAGEKSIPRRGT